jgi:ATP-dependent DNA helicase PIF1
MTTTNINLSRFSLRSQVDDANKSKLDKLPGQARTFRANDSGKYLDKLKEVLAPSLLVLKVGAQVMLIKNQKDDNSLVNGTMGTVESFSESSGVSVFI